MKRILRTLRLPYEDKSLLLKSVLLLGAIRLGLWVVPFPTLLRIVKRLKRGAVYAQGSDMASVKRVARAVRLMSRFVPAASCLTQALATVVLLGRLGHPACLRIGVAKSGQGRLNAHAWVESHGRIIIGGRVDLSMYTMLPNLEQKTL